MNKEEFCSWIKEIREKKLSRKEMANRYPWHENTIKSYEKDRLPDVDYLYALSVASNYNFKILLERRIETGIDELHYQMNEREQMLSGLSEKLRIENLEYMSRQMESDNSEHGWIDDDVEPDYGNPALDIQSHLEAEDDAMEPTIKLGAICEIDYADTLLTPGGVYSFSGLDSPKYPTLSILRRVQSSLTGSIILVPDNPKYEREEFTGELKKNLKVLGRLKSVKNPL